MTDPTAGDTAGTTDRQVRRTEDRFEIHADASGTPAGFTLYRDFTTPDGAVQRIFPHTEIRGEFGGQGLASILVRQALDQSIQDGMAIVPVCPYVKSWVEKHEGYAEHVVKPTPDHLQFLSQR